MKSAWTRIDIDASPSRVWEILRDLDGWPTWTDVLRDVHATPSLGGKISFRIFLDGMPGLPIQARIREWTPERSIAWGGGLGGVFAGHHYFRLEPLGEDRTTLTHGEDFTGALATLALRPSVLRRIERTYEKLNRQLKARIERS